MPDTQITASIVIPMRNEERYIGRCLDSVLQNGFPQSEYEIIVVDGESTDRSREVVLDRCRRFPNLVLLRNPARIVPPAMNLGIRASRGRYIIRMDAHSEYPPDYIRSCVEELERTGAANVGGYWITRPGSESPAARAIALLTQTRIGVGNASFRLGAADRYVDTVPFGAFRREVLEKVGLYREDLVRNQDFELNARIRESGERIYLSPRIHNVYYNAPTVRAFLRQAVLNGVWSGRAWIRYPVCFCWRHAAPLAFVGALMLWLSLAPLSSVVFRTGAVIFSAYAAIVLGTALRLAFRHGWQYLALVPALTVAYHLTYGIATIGGLLTAGRRSLVAPPPLTASQQSAEAA